MSTAWGWLGLVWFGLVWLGWVGLLGWVAWLVVWLVVWLAWIVFLFGLVGWICRVVGGLEVTAHGFKAVRHGGLAGLCPVVPTAKACAQVGHAGHRGGLRATGVDSADALDGSSRIGATRILVQDSRMPAVWHMGCNGCPSNGSFPSGSIVPCFQGEFLLSRNHSSKEKQ